jgi:uncharacterized protein (UPF0332 family)
LVLILNEFNWTEYNTLANELSKISTSEPFDIASITYQASLRCAISRAYYSAFCEARKYLDEIESVQIRQSERGSVHKLVLNEFINESGLKQKIGQNLKFLAAERVRVDYDSIYIGLNAKKAQLCVKKANFVITDLHTLVKSADS